MLPFLHAYEGKTWSEIRAEMRSKDQRHKSYQVDQICQENQKRLFDLKLDDLEEVFRFRLGNKPRMYRFPDSAYILSALVGPRAQYLPH